MAKCLCLARLYTEQSVVLPVGFLAAEAWSGGFHAAAQVVETTQAGPHQALSPSRRGPCPLPQTTSSCSPHNFHQASLLQLHSSLLFTYGIHPHNVRSISVGPQPCSAYRRGLYVNTMHRILLPIFPPDFCSGSLLCKLVLHAETQLLQVVRLSDLVCCFCAELLRRRAARKMCSAQCWGLCSPETPSQCRMAGRGQVCCPCCLHTAVMAHWLSGNYLLPPIATPSHACSFSNCMKPSHTTFAGRPCKFPKNCQQN